MKKFLRNKKGLGLVEYGIIVAVVVAVALGGMGIFGSKAKSLANNLGSDITTLKVNTTNTATGAVTSPTAGSVTVNSINIQ